MIETSALTLTFDGIIVIMVAYLIGLVSCRVMSVVALRKGHESESDILRDLGRRIRGFSILIGIVVAAGVTGLATQFESLTILGLIGLGFTVYTEELVSETISAFVMVQHKVLKEGDHIMIRDVKGQVVKITSRHTFLKTPEGKVVLVGNYFLASGPLTNYTASERLKDDPWFNSSLTANARTLEL